MQKTRVQPGGALGVGRRLEPERSLEGHWGWEGRWSLSCCLSLIRRGESLAVSFLNKNSVGVLIALNYAILVELWMQTEVLEPALFFFLIHANSSGMERKAD